MMKPKVLTVAIAGVLAAPMAAHAVDFAISGHVNRALFITDTDSSTSAMEADNGSSGSRIRVVGSGEMMDGTTAGLLLEYGAGGDGGASLSLRYADLHYSGEFGKVSIGHGNDAGEGSVYSDKSGVLGIGHGQATGDASDSGVTSYYGSLDGGGSRGNRIRYDTPSIGPVSAAISVGNGDELSAGVTLSQSFGDTSFGAKVGTTQSPGDNGTVSASAGAKLSSGLTVSGAWGSQEGAADPSFFQAMVGYVTGDTSVAVSWYASSDFVNDGSTGTVTGIGVNHNLPTIGANVYVAAQNYSAEDDAAAIDTDATVLMIGTRIKF
jgi:predicted porin